MAEFDSIAKHLIHTYPHDFARFALQQDDIQILGVVDTEQPTAPIASFASTSAARRCWSTTSSKPPTANRPCRAA